MARQLFGTDGIRGVAGEYPLDPKTVHATGVALGRFSRHVSTEPAVIIGMDTRESGPWIASQFASGLAESGVDVHFAGVISTPGVAWLTRTDPYVAGVMISASHNPYHDNGIKIFGHSGYKLPDDSEHRIEIELLSLLQSLESGGGVPLAADATLDRRYLNALRDSVPGRLNGLRIIADCGHGAASHLAPQLLEELGVRVTAVNCSPNGRNINDQCGALHVERLREAVIESGADAGVAFDGDADRAIFVSSSGRIVDGDAVLLLTARSMKARGLLAGDVVVSTVMSNLGFERALGRAGIRLLRAPVGDKYVLEEMIKSGAVIGGEQSGHVIFHRESTTGDGMLTALRVFEIMVLAGVPLDELVADFVEYPQKLLNVRIRERRKLDEMPGVQQAIRECENAFGADGRVLVRFSGTEPLARVMIEGPDAGAVSHHAEQIANAIRQQIGA